VSLIDVHVTCGSRAEADRIAEHLVTERLAACVHLSEVASTYHWQGEVAHDTEVLLVALTVAERWEAVAAAIGALHSYELAAITWRPVGGATVAVEAWVEESTAAP
jgi:uncharacterized protein involved in tolerance to divalent cations